MQNAAISALGLNWRYLAFEVAPTRLAEALLGCRAMKFVGVNLTVPHKLLAVDLVDELDDSAKEWGAVNTVRFEARTPDGSWHPVAQLPDPLPDDIRTVGFNTDAEGITLSLEEDLGLSLKGLRVLLLGAGGAGRVAALKLASAGAAELFLVNRTESRAREVAAEIGRRSPCCTASVGYPSGTVDLVLNATSLGLGPGDAAPWSESEWSFQRAGAAYDMIYRPAETPFLARARSAGCRTANGLGMLLHQGARALEIWSGRPAPADIMRAALHRQIYGR